MLDPDGLNVWNDQRLVGYLWRNTQGLIGFRYEKEWLTQGGFAISHRLPLRQEDFVPEEGLAHRFFANLLPEGGARDQVIRDLKIANTDFDLLRAIGGECAGALSILQAEQKPSTQYAYYELSEQELAKLVTRRGQVYTWTENERPRLSLAGAQDKCPVLIKNGACWLPKKESPSSHILKFELSDYRHLPAYETFTTLLAGAIGLPVVDIQLRSIADTHYALIERYDRHQLGSGQMVRLHQEDFCQALGFGHERKYQEDGGPSFADCYRLVQDVSSDPANDLQYLLRWQIFNVLAGNSDGHAKNLSLLYRANGEIQLAPFMTSFALGPLNVLTIIWHFPLAMKEIQASFPQSTGMTWRNNAVCVLGFCKARCRMLLSVCWSTCRRREKSLKRCTGNIPRCNGSKRS